MIEASFSVSGIYALLCNPQEATKLPLDKWRDLIWLLRHAKLLASFYHVAKTQGCFCDYPEYARKHLYSAAVLAKRQKQQVLFECEEIHALLQGAGIQSVFLKGAGYSLRNSVNNLGRIYSDIDILVSHAQLADAERVLRSNLWRSKSISDYDEKYYREWAHEIPPMHHLLRGTVIDVHHNLYLPVSGRAPDIDLFWAMTQCTENGLQVLSEPAAVLHAIIHLFTNEDSSSGMRDLWDIYLLVSAFSIPEDWLKLLELADKTGFSTELAYCFESLVFYFPIQYPDEVIQFRQHRPLRGGHKIIAKKIIPLALVPEHPMVNHGKNKLAKLVFFIRGHWLKMPLLVLFKHLLVKGWTALKCSVMGKYHLDEETSQKEL